MNSLKNIVVALALTISLVLVATSCSRGPDLSTPSGTVTKMAELAENGKWAIYLDQFYGENYKIHSESHRKKLISRLQGKWGGDMLPKLKESMLLEPKISEDGQKAVYKLKRGTFTLYKSEQGRWTFHL